MVSNNQVLYTRLLIRQVARHYPGSLDQLSLYIGQPLLRDHIRRFLYDQVYPDADLCGMDALIDMCPDIHTGLGIKVYHSASSTYYAPSDLSGTGGLLQERIQAVPCWKGGPARYDCVFIETDANAKGFSGLHVARVKLFFSFSFQEATYSCALVEWFSTYGESPCAHTGLWRVVPDCDARGQRVCSVIHIDTILRGAHLIGVPGPQLLPKSFTYHDSMDAFQMFYVNKYADHHAHEIAF